MTTAEKISIALPSEMVSIVRSAVATGEYASSSEVIRDALRDWTHKRSMRQHGITEQTYYRWKAKYGGMENGDARKLKQLEDENQKLKHVVAELTLDNRALKDVLSKNF